MKNAVQELVEMFGSQAKLGRALGMKQQNVMKYARDGRFPANHVLRAVKLSKGTIPAERFNPDFIDKD